MMKMDNEIILLTDYKKDYYHSTAHPYKDGSMNTDTIQAEFAALGWDLHVKQLSDIDFKNENYQDAIILYQSSEDRHLLYKSYIEDVLLGLELQGAVLIPPFRYFRAHHNKVFMEILRDISKIKDIKNIDSRYYGTIEDFSKDRERLPDCVLKPSEGCGSLGIVHSNNKKSQIKYAKTMSRSFHLKDYMRSLIKSLVFKTYVRRSDHRRKFISQQFISDLEFDYKILVYSNKYYVLQRGVRENDFRASGSGLFEFPQKVDEKILDFSESVFQGFHVPFISMDIGYNNNECFLFEFQFVNFGNYTLVESPQYFKRDKRSNWTTVEEKTLLEKQFAISVVEYLGRITG